MKRFLSVALVAVMLVCMCAVSMLSTSAETAVKVTADSNSATVNVGDVVKYTFTMNAGTVKIIAVQGTLTYSSNLKLITDYSLDKDKDPDFLTNMYPITGKETVCNTELENTVKYNYSNVAGAYFDTADSAVMTVMFEVVAAGEAVIDNKLEYVMDKNQKKIIHDGVKLVSSCKCTGKVYTGTTYMIGDVDGNGVVNITDASYLQMYVAGDTLSGFNKTAADVNNDNATDITDASYIQMYVAGEVLPPIIEVGKKMVIV